VRAGRWNHNWSGSLNGTGKNGRKWRTDCGGGRLACPSVPSRFESRIREIVDHPGAWDPFAVLRDGALPSFYLRVFVFS
jgi:hypothetical protein